MNAELDLKEIEKRAYRSIFQDGLWDIYSGLVVILIAVLLHRPESGYTPFSTLMMVFGLVILYGLFVAGKKFITIPRMGQVKFGEVRKRRWRRVGIILGVVILLQVTLVILTALGGLIPALDEMIGELLGSANRERLLVALVASLFVGCGMLVLVFFTDFPRGYYIVILMSLVVFLMIFFNRPLFPIMIGVVILIPGVILLIRFLKKYPLPRRDSIQ